VPNFEHASLCRAFGLDPNRFWFDLPSSVRGVGSIQAAYGGCWSARYQSGFVLMFGQDRPVAKLTICKPGERFADSDPHSREDFENLQRY
jgi:hypothetical protein